jgi:hypothetical protein
VQKLIFELETGEQRTVEVYYGSGFLSQSSRKVRVPENTTDFKAYDFQGKEVK